MGRSKISEEIKKVFDCLATKNGYRDGYELLMDYSFIPTVLMPNHSKIEIVKLFLGRKSKKK